MNAGDTDPELTGLGLLAFVLASAGLMIALLPHFPLDFCNLPFLLALSLGFVGACALYAGTRLGSRWVFWIVLAKDVAIGLAFLILGLVIGCRRM